MKRVVREIGVFAFFLLMAIVITWPLAIRLSTGVCDPGDPLLNAFILDWDCWAFLHQPLHLFAAPFLAPAHLPLAFSENMVGIAIFALPFALFGAKAITLHSIAMILGFAMSGYGAYVLARVVARSIPAAVIAGLFHAYLSFRISHLSHVQIIWGGWLPLILAALIVLHRNPTRRNAVLFSAAFAMNGLTNIYFLMFSIAAVLLTVWMFSIADGRLDRVFRRRALFALIGAGVVLLPFLIPYAIVSSEYHMQRNIGDALSGSASWSDWLVAAGNNALWGPLTDPSLPRPERNLFPGLVPLLLFIAALLFAPARSEPVAEAEVRRAPRLYDVALAILAVLAYLAIIQPQAHFGFGNSGYSGSDIPLMLFFILLVVRCRARIHNAIARSRFSVDAWAALVWIGAGFLGSFGLNAFFSEFLFRRTLIFRSVRAMARFGSITYVGLAAWMAIGIVVLLSYVKRPVWRAVAIAIVAVAELVDLAPSLHWQYMTDPPSESALWIRDHRAQLGGSVLELPMNNWGSMYLYELDDTVHHAPMMNGISGFEPPVHRWLREADMRFQFDDRFTNVIEKNGCAIIVVNSDLCGRQGPPIGNWLARNLAAGRMSFVGRFDHWTGGDWLFAVTRNAHVHGVRASPELAAFLAGKPTYNHTTFGRMDRPKDGETVSGPLLVTGWALSPYGVKSATVLLDGGRDRIPAVLTPRPDITQTWPWYPKCPTPAITARIGRNPHDADTDLQLEIIDGRGVATRFRDAFIHWTN